MHGEGRFRYINMGLPNMYVMALLLFGCEGEVETVKEKDQNPNGKFTFETTDSQRCPQGTMKILEVVPGSGWDNLRNLNMGQVLDVQYAKCHITPDRKFLIPDHVYTVPLKESGVQHHSEVFTHSSNYTSLTSNTINIEAFGLFEEGVISGSFSWDHQSSKSHIVGDKTVTSRTQLRYVLYNVQSQPDPVLHPTFKERLMDLASFIQAGDTYTSTYLAELLVRDYGTHYISGVDAGAVLVQEDQVNSSYVNDVVKDKTTLSIAAGASFLAVFGMKADYSHSHSNINITKYRQNCVDSKVKSFGGPILGANFSLDKWVKDIENNLITVDRNGDPLHYLITVGTLPDLPVDTVQELAGKIESAIASYYKYNTYRGCTDIDSPNFSYFANFDDHSCKASANNYTFGGVFQNCTGGRCSGHTQVNPLTGTYSCPPEYIPILIHTGSEIINSRHCKFPRIHWRCRDDWTSKSYKYMTFWCAATSSVSAKSGYLFGGTFTSSTNNPLTQAKSCPPYYVPLKLGYNPEMYVCVSDDYELGYRYSIPFAGFFSCSSGNPLAFLGNTNSLQEDFSNANSATLRSFMLKPDLLSWSKGCPEGFSGHVFAIIDGCEINYCAKANSLTGMAYPIIRRPPFQSDPKILYNATRILVTSLEGIMAKGAGRSRWMLTNLTTHSDMTDIFALVDPASQILPSTPGDSNFHNKGSSVGIAVTLSVLGTAIAGIFILLLVLKIKSYREHNTQTDEYSHIDGHDIENEAETVISQPETSNV